MTTKAQQRRLARAGYAAVSAWLPKAEAERVQAKAEAHRAEVERILAEPPKPRGRPRKGA